MNLLEGLYVVIAHSHINAVLGRRKNVQNCSIILSD